MTLALVLGAGWVAAVAAAASAVVLVGFLAAAGPRRRALHDRLSGTAVFAAR